MLGKLSIEIGPTTYVIVKSGGGVVALHNGGFESESDANEAATRLGASQVGTDYSVQPVTVVNSRKAGAGRKPGRKPAEAPATNANATPPRTPTAVGVKS